MHGSSLSEQPLHLRACGSLTQRTFRCRHSRQLCVPLRIVLRGRLSISLVWYDDIVLDYFADAHGSGTSAISVTPFRALQQWKVERLKLGDNVAVTREISTRWRLHKTSLDTWPEPQYDRV